MLTSILTTRAAVAIAAVAVAAAGAGCGSDANSGSKSHPEKSAATATGGGVPDGLAGTYERAVTARDIARTEAKRQEGPGQERPKPAKTRLVIRGTGIDVTEIQSGFTIAQDYKATPGGVLTIQGYQNPGKGSFCGPEVPQNASYSWKVNRDRALVLRARDDRCADRDSTMTGLWTRVR
jgi:hypothetical protein